MVVRLEEDLHRASNLVYFKIGDRASMISISQRALRAGRDVGPGVESLVQEGIHQLLEAAGVTR